MLLMHEVHRVRGSHADAFEEAYRDGWMPALAREEGARLLWYFNHAHGCGVSFNVVTVTAIGDWSDWERLALRVQQGDLQAWARGVDGMRYGSSGMLLEAAGWSPLEEIDLAAIPVDGSAAHAVAMYVEDTIAPDGGDPVASARAIAGTYPRANSGGAGPATDGRALSELTGVLQPAIGAGRRQQIILLQKILDLDLLAEYYRTGGPIEGAPWSARQDPMPIAGSWSTKLLRTSTWSPWN